MDGQKFLTEFLEAGRAHGMASDDAYETGFATLTDKEGHPYVAHLDSGTKEGKSKKDEGKKEPESKKTEEKKKPEAEKKVKFNVGNINYEFTEEEAEKQLRYNDKYIPESEKELKEFTEKKKTIDKERETVEPLDKFYSDYKKALDKFDDDSYLAAASYFNKYKDRFGYLKGQALKTVKNDTGFDYDRTEKRQKEYSDKAKNLFRESVTLRDQIESSKNDIKQRTDVSNSLRKALAQDSLDLFINNVNEEKVQSLKKTIGLAQDNALTSYFEDIEIY